MHRAAEQVLTDVLVRYGKSVCDTPHMLETLLRKHGRACPHEVENLAAVLRCGVVTDLRSEPAADTAALARVLVLNARLPEAKAEWAVAAWTAALAHAPNTGMCPPTAEAPTGRAGPFSAGRVAVVLSAAAVTGVIAYLTFGR